MMLIDIIDVSKTARSLGVCWCRRIFKYIELYVLHIFYILSYIHIHIHIVCSTHNVCSATN